MKIKEAKQYKSFYGAGNAVSPDVGNDLKGLPSATPKSPKEAHTDHTKYGMGNFYGTGFKAKIGRVRGSTVGYRPVTREQMGTPPRSVV